MKLFEDKIKNIVLAEKKMANTIIRMIKNTTSPELILASKEFLQESNQLVERLDSILDGIKKRTAEKNRDATKKLIEEAKEIIKSHEACSKRNAGIISTAQDIEYYEIATFGTLRQCTETLGLLEAFTLLATTLEVEEENITDEKISKLSNATINIEATDSEALKESKNRAFARG
jgi:ferritin-like metal-binding protein YciE